MMRTRGARRGLALPVVLLATALLTVALAVTFTMVGTERRVTNNFRGQLLAFSLAQTGLERCTTSRITCGFATADPSGAYDSSRVALSNGYADVIFEQLRDTIAGGVGIYAVRSRGVLTTRGASADPLAERTVAQIAYYSPRKFSLPAGFTALNGLSSLSATTILIRGTPPVSCVRPGVNSFAAPVSPSYTGTSPATELPELIRNLGPAVTAGDSIRIDWDGIVNRGTVTPDVKVPPGTFPVAPVWQTIEATANLIVDASNSGSGLLIVHGNLNVSGAWSWDGLVLVGGSITGAGDHTVRGAIVTGLNVKLGMAVPLASDLGTGDQRITYNPCMLDSALARIGGFGVFRNVWMDAWKAY
ncbi:MAG: hypothetical protein ABJD07_04415 [Gemmatimonadaceae bacterium]